MKEQKLINPNYRKLKESSINKLQKTLRKENALSKMLPGLEFEGSLSNIPDRWLYGMKMMHSENSDINK